MLMHIKPTLWLLTMEAQDNPWKKPCPQEQDNDIPTENYEKDMDNFENVEHENHTTLKTLT